MLQRYFWGVTG